MQYIVKHEGQEIPVPEEIGTDEQKLRRALSQIIPGIAEAKITTQVKDDVTTFSIVKTAGTKGAGQDPVAYLVGCPGGKNPAVACYEELQALDLAEMQAADTVKLDEKIGKAFEQGERQVNLMDEALKGLCTSSAQPSPVVIAGF